MNEHTYSTITSKKNLFHVLDGPIQMSDVDSPTQMSDIDGPTQMSDIDARQIISCDPNCLRGLSANKSYLLLLKLLQQGLQSGNLGQQDHVAGNRFMMISP